MRYGGIPDSHGILLADTEAGPITPATFDLTLDNHRRARIETVHFTLATSLLGAARRARLEVRSGATILWRIEAQATQAANTTRGYNFAPRTRDATAFTNNQLQTPLPHPALIPPGFTLRIDFTNRTATDELSDVAIISENWIDG